MKTRDNMSAAIERLQRDHGLLVAYLEATDRIDWRAALHERVVIGEPPKPRPLTTSTFVFRRPNLVQVDAQRVSCCPRG